MTGTGHTTAILGYFGYQNAGDDAFYDFWIERLGVPCSALASDLRGQRVKSAILGGGAVVNDYFLERLPDTLETLSLFGCSLPYGDDDVRRLSPFADRVTTAQFRSRRDARVARRLLPQARYVPDLIFGHDMEERSLSIEEIVGHCEIPPAGFDSERKNLVLLLSDQYRASELDRFFAVESFKYQLADALDYLSQFYNVICIPMSMWHDSRDNIFAADVVSRMRKRESVAVIDRYLGPRYIYQAIKSQASLVVTMKYHGIVFSMSAGKPFINIGDTRKNQDLLHDSDLTALDCGLAHFDKDRFLETVKLAESDSIRDTISAVAAQNRIDVLKVVDEFRGTLDFSPL